MPQLENKDILGIILRSTIGVISRRTSEAYANIIISNAIKELEEKYSFLQYIEIRGKQYNEMYDVVSIKQDINNFEIKEVSEAAKFFIQKIIREMGKNVGYYFLREIKEDLGSAQGIRPPLLLLGSSPEVCDAVVITCVAKWRMQVGLVNHV